MPKLSEVEIHLSKIDSEAKVMANRSRANVLTGETAAIRQLWAEEDPPAPDPVPIPDPTPPPVSGDALHVYKSDDWFNKVDGATDKEAVVHDGVYDLGTGVLRGSKLRVFAANRPNQGRDGIVRPTAKIKSSGANFFGGGTDLYFEGLEIFGPRESGSGKTGHAFNQVNGLEVVLCYLHHCQASAIGGNSKVRVRRSEVFANGDPSLVGHNSGGVKAVDAGTGWEESKLGMLCEYVYAHSNIGPGLWGDRGCRFYIFRYNLCVSNHKAGIRWEIGAHVDPHDAEAEIHHNRGWGNGRLAPSDSGLIRVNSCNSAYIHHNVSGPNEGGVGITAGGSRHPIYDVVVENNRMVGGDRVSLPSGNGNRASGNGPDTAVDELQMLG